MTNYGAFLRWAGGKSWLIPLIQQLTSNIQFNNYFEPFMGGASIFFSLEIDGKAYLSDINEELVGTFIAIRDNPTDVIRILKTYKTDEESYYRIRAQKPRIPSTKAARFIYLNAYSYNGLYRVNKEGLFNVPYGQRGNAKIDYDRLLLASEKLKNTSISSADFNACEAQIQEHDLVFLDPPYVTQTKNNMFIAYNSTLFSLDDQKRLGEFIDSIRQKGAYFILTNAAHPTILDIFQGRGRLVTVERNSLIGGKTSYRGKVNEYIFTNIPEGAHDNVQD